MAETWLDDSKFVYRGRVFEIDYRGKVTQLFDDVREKTPCGIAR